MRPSYYHTHNTGHPRQSYNGRRGFVPANIPSVRPPFHERRHGYGRSFRRDHFDYRQRPPSFIVELVCSSRCSPPSKTDVEGLVAKCKFVPQSTSIYPSNSVAATFIFSESEAAREALLSLWQMRLEGVHDLTPKLSSSLMVTSCIEELREAVKVLFVDWTRGFFNDGAVTDWEKKLQGVQDEIVRVSKLLKRSCRLHDHEEFASKKKALASERDLILRRLNEFKSSIISIIALIEGNQSHDHDSEFVEIFKIENELDWDRVHRIVMRERRRLDQALPIYAFRQDILRILRSQQIIVLIGETGSGKSTQLVQFLADSGIASSQSIVCTQPRKIAAISLAHRVEEESNGCYENTSALFYPTCKSLENLTSKIVYATDHCLLQHYMNNRSLSGFSCIIIDEAHERSLNTDLLLAMVKKLLYENPNLRLVIMSATADADQLSKYFFGCETFHVTGRTFPVDIKYVPSDGASRYVDNVVKQAMEIDRMEKEGTVLAFLTSQTEVEWACENFRSPTAVSLPLHGKLSHEEQLRVFASYPGRRKVIFSTNIAETSLTIPGVRYVVDSGMVKESKFEPHSGMNILRVCWTSKSSANQRAGRGGRTEPGKCYRLYTKVEFDSLPSHQEPEIRRVHLGVAVLRILALGMRNIRDFDFIDSPCLEAIDTAVKNLIQLGAVTSKNSALELTEEGRYLVKMGIEPRLGKLILCCYHYGLGREGLVLAAVMANSSSIFCRVGSMVEKSKSDCLKVQFCHRNGDLFTLLSVYREWAGLPSERRNRWCWENSINAKSLRRCHDTVMELEICLQNEVNRIIPSYWMWDPLTQTEYDRNLTRAILSSLVGNVAMYSGYDQLGYEVVLTRRHLLLHPSCSLLVFGKKPQWIVFGEILSMSNDYLVCASAFDVEMLTDLCPSPSYDISDMESRKLEVVKLTGFGSVVMKKFCGKANRSLHGLIARIRAECGDERIGVEVDVDQNEILVFASSHDRSNVCEMVKHAIGCEKKWLQNECLEKCLYHGSPGVSPTTALFGSGGVIKYIKLDERFLTVDLSFLTSGSVDDKSLLHFLEEQIPDSICAVQRLTLHDSETDKWGRVTFLSPDAAERAVDLTGTELHGSFLKVTPRAGNASELKPFSYSDVSAKVYWPRRLSSGSALVKCHVNDVDFMIGEISNLIELGYNVRCVASSRYKDGVVVRGLDRNLSEDEIMGILRRSITRRICDFFLMRGDAVAGPSLGACQEALLKEVSRFMVRKGPCFSPCRVRVFPPEPKDFFMKGSITFDGRLHLEAAKALECMEGKVLPGCLPWQKIKCQRMFHSSLSCPASVYGVISKQLDSVISGLRRLQGVECSLERNLNGSYRVKISANATRVVAELRRPLEELMRGKCISDARLNPAILQPLFSKEGISAMRSIERETHTCILFDRHNLTVRIFGPSGNACVAEQKLVRSLLTIHENKFLEVHLRGGDLPPNLMKEVVNAFGPDLHKLKEKVPEADSTLSTRFQVIQIRGSPDAKSKVEQLVSEIAEKINGSTRDDSTRPTASCPICLCEIEDKYRLEACGHSCCRACLVDQCLSAAKSQDAFPVGCVACGTPFWLTDLRTLLSGEKLEDLFRASLSTYVATSGGVYRFCPSPDCPSVYRVTDTGDPFLCGACYAETCTKCHAEYHAYISCEVYKEFKSDPDCSLREWCKGKENVKTCPICGSTIEKGEGCNHVECRCGIHICWNCLECFESSEDCYTHLRSIHLAI